MDAVPLSSLDNESVPLAKSHMQLHSMQTTIL